jgi:hypothetical protein
MTRSHAILGLSIAALLLSAAAANAQQCSTGSCTATNTVSVHVGTVLRLGVQGSTALVATLANTRGEAGRVGTGTTALVRSNGAWRLAVSAVEPTWTPVSGSARPDKSANTPGTQSSTVRLTLVGA